MPSFQKMDRASWTCFHLKLASIFAISRKNKATGGGCQAGKNSLTCGDSSQATRVTSRGRGCVTLVCAALRSRFAFRLITRPVFPRPLFPALRNDIPQNVFSGALQKGLVLAGG